ncbi:MAG: alpha-L-arabinofuranosidase, partial [Christensenellaceae bacterium]
MKATSTLQITTEKIHCHAAEDFYGLFFEDINRAGDSGIYPEMIRNRSFEDSIPPHDVTMYGEDNAVFVNEGGWPDVFYHGEGIPRWTKDLPYTPIPAWYADRATIALSEKTLNANREAALDITFEKGGKVYNVGYAGVSVKENDTYAFYCFASSEGIDVSLSLEGKDGSVYAQESIHVEGGYRRYDVTFQAKGTDHDALFVLRADEGKLLLGFTSLMPTDTYKGHGLRKDLCEMLKGLSPKFLRFPGGCIVEGLSKSTAMRFSRTIGPVWERPSHQLMWHYRATNGLGFHEYLQLCEDLQVAPLYVVNVGLTCQARVASLFEGEELDCMLQEAFDALEYAMGDVTTPFGKLRAENGHPEPFKIKYVEIGNENFGPDYFSRYKKYYDALKAKYPDIIYISNCHTEWERLPTEVVDEHYYDTPNFFSEHA